MKKTKKPITKNGLKKMPSTKIVDKSVKEKYSVFTTFTKKQISVSRGPVSITVNIDEKHIELSGANGKEFIFRNKNNVETIKRWDQVIGCLAVAIHELKEQRKLK